MAFQAVAQDGDYNNYFGLNLGGGANTMTYKQNRGDYLPGVGFDGGLHFASFFNAHWGFGFGVHYTYANSHTLYDNFIENSSGLTHFDNTNVHYTLNAKFTDWMERQTVGVLGIPIEVFFRKPVGKKNMLIAGLGFQIDLPLHGHYDILYGTYTTKGQFVSLGSYYVQEMPEHGFSTYDDATDTKIDNLVAAVSVIGDFGVRFPLKNDWGFYLGVYAGYSIPDMLGEQTPNQPLLMINTDNPSQIDYYGTFASTQTTNLHLVRAGVKLGIDIGWKSGKKAAERAAAEAKAAAEREAAERAAAEKAAAEKAAAEKAAAEKAAAEKAAAEKAAAEKAAAEKAAAEKAAAEKAAADRAAAEKAAADRAAAEAAAAQAAADRAAAEAAAAKAAAERAAAEKALAEAQRQIADINATVYFQTDKTDAMFDSKTDDALHAISEALKMNRNVTITVYGHTDYVGSSEYNMKLGMRRAEVLKAYLVKLGAPAENIICQSHGEDEPIADNSTPEGRALNRRATVELKIK